VQPLSCGASWPLTHLGAASLNKPIEMHLKSAAWQSGPLHSPLVDMRGNRIAGFESLHRARFFRKQLARVDCEKKCTLITNSTNLNCHPLTEARDLHCTVLFTLAERGFGHGVSCGFGGGALHRSQGMPRLISASFSQSSHFDSHPHLSHKNAAPNGDLNPSPASQTCARFTCGLRVIGGIIGSCGCFMPITAPPCLRWRSGRAKPRLTTRGRGSVIRLQLLRP